MEINRHLDLNLVPSLFYYKFQKAKVERAIAQ